MKRKAQGAEEEAADWVLRSESGLTEAEAAEFERWLRSSPGHAALFQGLNETSAFLDKMGDPEAGVSPLAPLAKRKRSPIRRVIAFGLAAAAAAAAVFIFVSLRRAAPSSPRLFQETVETSSGEVRHVDLPDGSAIHLNAGSSVTIAYRADSRRVHLSAGEAFFSVAKNPARPFFVEAGVISVRAVGTAFNVKYSPEAVEVLVTEGKVRVDDSAGHSILPPKRAAPAAHELLLAGQKADVHLATAGPAVPQRVEILEVKPTGMEADLAWRDPPLVFTSAPLTEVVATFNRYNAHKLVIADGELAQQRFGGEFFRHDYESFVEVLQQAFGVVAERDGDTTVLRQGR